MFRFHIPFFSNKSHSRLSPRTSSPSSPPTPPPPPPPSRPPFLPAGIAQPSKPDTKSKMSPSLSRVKSNVAAIAASLSASPSSSNGASTPTRLAKQTNKLSGSPSKKPESLRTEEQKLTMKEKPSGETEKVAGENINPVIEKPPIARSEEHLERKEAKTVPEQRNKTEGEKLTVQERKKVLPEGREEKLEADQGQQKRKEKEKLAVQENKRVFPEGSGVKSETDQKQQKIKEKEKLVAQESKTVLHEAGQEKSEVNRMRKNREAPQGQQKKKENEEREGREDATRSKTARHMAAASEATRVPKDLPETKTKTQNRAEIHTGDNHQKTKGASTSNLGNTRVKNEEGSSSMSKRIKEDVRDGISKLTWGKSNGDEKSVSVFTLTGENRGATMGICSEKDNKDGEVHIHRGYRSNPDESPNNTTTETEGGRRKPFTGKNLEDEDEEDRVRAYVNGNTQGINNSIVVESSVSENDPGIHMSLIFEISKKEIINQPENVAEKKPETVKATEKLKSEPRVRRRCLRGLLAETSESVPENPLKPRKHGCRFTCKDKDIENT